MTYEDVCKLEVGERVTMRKQWGRVKQVTDNYVSIRWQRCDKDDVINKHSPLWSGLDKANYDLSACQIGAKS